MKSSIQDVKLSCYHCGDSCDSSGLMYNDLPFCCSGCKLVYQVLSENKMCEYYSLSDHPGHKPKVQKDAGSFGYLDNSEVIEKFVTKSAQDFCYTTLSLPQMHCISCLWILENLSRFHKGIISSKVNFQQKNVQILFNSADLSFRKIVELLTQIGYEPQINLDALELSSFQRNQRKRLYKIGIVGFCFANIMMVSLPGYFGLLMKNDSLIYQTLLLYSFILSIPVLLYGASEFFVNAWNSIRQKYINIDVPIALAILVTFFRSIYEGVFYSEMGYLDSMSGIVFFMLIGRFLQDKVLQFISFEHKANSFFPLAVEVTRNGVVQTKLIHQIATHDRIRIYNEEIIPVDGILLDVNCMVDYSFVTGESLPVSCLPGDTLYAGGKSVTGAIEIMAKNTVSENYLTQLWNKENKTEEDLRAFNWLDTLSKNFSLLILSIAMVAGIYWFLDGEYLIMWNVITTVLIVACPCTLLLSSTFTYGNFLRILNKNGLYVKNYKVIDKIAAITHICFDKTGTLTDAHKANISYTGQVLDDELIVILSSLLNHSSHYASQLIYSHLGCKTTVPVASFKEIKGQGIEGWVNDRHVKIGSLAYTGMDSSVSRPPGLQVVICIDRKLIGIFYISNFYRPGIRELVSTLKKKFTLSLLSGDNNSEKKQLEEIFGPNVDLKFDQNPLDKQNYIQHLERHDNIHMMMIGDGLNDVGALLQSTVGLAVSEKNNRFTPASDGIIESAQLIQLDRILRFCSRSKSIILAGFSFSLLYNIIGLYFALQGALTPLIAALIMPLSSLSIILLSLGITAWQAKSLGLSGD